MNKIRTFTLSPVGGTTVVTHRAGNTLRSGMGGDERQSIEVIELKPVLDLLENWLRPASARNLMPTLGMVEVITQTLLSEHGRMEGA